MSDARPDNVQTLLAPLLKGQVVWLKVIDPRLPKKTRPYKTVLVIAPVRALGVRGPRLLVSMPPYGSEFLDPTLTIKGITFARLGMSFSLASALADALRKLYGGRHGRP